MVNLEKPLQILILMEMDQIGLDQEIPGVLSSPNGELGGLAAMVLELSQKVIDALVHQEAFVDAHKLACLPIDKTQRAVPVDGEPSVVPVAQLVGRWPNLRNGGVCKFADALEGVGHFLVLGFQLGVVG